MSRARWAALVVAVFIQAVALTFAIDAFNVWAALAIGGADAIIAVVCFEAAS